jgi:hypothetical protein
MASSRAGGACKTLFGPVVTPALRASGGSPPTNTSSEHPRLIPFLPNSSI